MSSRSFDEIRRITFILALLAISTNQLPNAIRETKNTFTAYKNTKTHSSFAPMMEETYGVILQRNKYEEGEKSLLFTRFPILRHTKVRLK